MDFLMQLLTGLVENQQGNQWNVVLMVAGAVFILVLAVLLLFDDFFDPVRSRFKREINTDAISMLESGTLLEKLRRHNNVFVPSDNSLLQRTTKRLHYGGFHGRNSLLHYYALRMLLMIALPLLVIIATVFQVLKVKQYFKQH